MNTEAARVLVLDDERDLRALLQRYLSDQGYLVRTVETAAQLDRLLQREAYDVLVLDIMLPDEDGLSICRRLRAQGETIPIIMLTARGEPVDRIIGREMGADDYLAKPFNPRELTACIQSLLRRQRMNGNYRRHDADQPIAFGDFLLHVEERRLSRAGATIPLTSGEFSLLKALVTHAGRPLGRERLLELAYGPGRAATDRSVDVQILRLRRIIEADAAHPHHIQTVWGVGYVFVIDSGTA